MPKVTEEQCVRLVMEIRRTFGGAPLLRSEDQERYYGIMKGLIKRTPPRDVVEMMLIRDTTNDMWEVLRCDRNKALVFNSKVIPRLNFQKKRQIDDQENEAAQKREAAEFNGPHQDAELTAQDERLIRLHGVIEETPHAVDELLERAETELIHLRTMQELMPFFQQIENMRSNATDRYREGLDLLEQSFGESTIDKGDDVVEAEYEMITPDATLVPDGKED
jgi:flagellar biosynthesis GTPase FlhF